MISFMSPIFLCLIPAVLLQLYLAYRRRASFGYSQLETQRTLSSMSVVKHLPPIFLSAFLICLCLALARPVVSESHSRQTIETRDFCIAVDVSGSMELEIDNSIAEPAVPANPTDNKTDNIAKDSRLKVAKAAIAKFIPGRAGDRICYIQFDDEAYFSWPLTTDLELISRHNSHLGSYSGGGTNFDGPDEAGFTKTGPIQAAIDHFKEMGEAKAKVLIIVSDGEASIQPERRQQLLTLLKQGNIRVYVLGIAQGWVIDSRSVQDLKQLAIDTGGKVMPVGDEAAMAAGFSEINQLEKTQVSVERQATYRDIYQYFVWAALFFVFGLSIVSALVREQPVTD
ncbi:VWA domain-containing protein [bacterium]|jgi:Mg-chelatase subunit ChlD|nr:VWA domain-containing protein [bacterium]MBP9811440.1 VWA domain-containing protein [bacterium]